MRRVNKNEHGEFELRQDYAINFVELTRKEEEHTHRFIELVYTMRGRGMHRVGDKEYHVKAGDLLLINYHSRHTVVPIENFYYVDIMLKPEYVSEALRGTDDLFLILQLQDYSDLSESVIRNNSLLHFDAQERQRIEFLLRWTAEEQEEQASAVNLMLHSALSMLLILVFRKMAETQNTRLAVNDLLLSYMERNCEGKLTVGEIARLCGYTPAHFSRIFRNYTGKTPTEYILDARVRKAMALLLKTDHPIEMIVAECGFTNRTAFFKKFAEYAGCTPLQYRKNQK